MEKYTEITKSTDDISTPVISESTVSKTHIALLPADVNLSENPTVIESSTEPPKTSWFDHVFTKVAVG